MPSAKEVKRALARVRAAMPREKQVTFAERNIRLGLERISRVVQDEQKWVGVHVGGTNGKGSICALLAGLFKLSGLSHGTFTSPAIPERHNGVTINGLYANKRMYEKEIEHVQAHFRRVASGWSFSSGEDPGELTPFELETAAAFRIFDKMHVKYGIVEVGMGGATDATNAMKQKGVTVISKIDLDHQEYLGNTIEDIAKVKAGIMRPGVPCIVDDSNPNSVLRVLRQHASSIGTQISPTWKAQILLESLDTSRFQLQDYEKQNLLCAALAFRHLFPNLDIDLNALLATRPFLPGRMEEVGVLGLTGGARTEPILVDGAHNMLGVQALAKTVDAKLRLNEKPVTWVLGLSASKSKPFAKLIETMVRPQDNVAFVEYTPGPNDPAPVPAELGRDYAKAVITDESQIYDADSTAEPGITPAVQWACEKAGSGPVVLAGSLYLIREFYKLKGINQKRKLKTRRPGRSQLWYYTQLAQQRALTPEEAREFKQARRHWHLSPERNSTFRDLQDGGKPAPPPVSERVRELQRNAAYHKKQADGYRSAISSTENDLKRAPSSDTTRQSTEEMESLGKSVGQLKKKREEHLKAYNAAMFRIRGHTAIPDKKFMTYEEIFGRPKSTKKTSPLSEAEDVASTPGPGGVGSSSESSKDTWTANKEFNLNNLGGGSTRKQPSRFIGKREAAAPREQHAQDGVVGEKEKEKERISEEAKALVDRLSGSRR